ncbi:MAG: antibiotic biosynthesis monooxygenase [Actinomycetota bacterium]|nr:antibiotic biosynthesis monooxygenase [Actinomycetota bacterium]
MSYVVVNAITVPPERGGDLEERFANRAGQVSGAEGFEAFQLLRPANDGAGDRYLVYTRWASKEAFQGWMSSQAFADGHSAASSPKGPVGTASEVWAYEVVQQEGA